MIGISARSIIDIVNVVSEAANGRRVLFVDDKEEICMLADVHLKRSGINAKIVSSADIAKREIESGDYDVLVTDYHLGDDVNGDDLAKLARSMGMKTASFSNGDSMRRSLYDVVLGKDYHALKKIAYL